MAAKNKAVKQLTGGVEGLLKKYKVDYIKGFGSFASPTTIKVKPLESEGGSEYELQTKHSIIAVGSEVVCERSLTRLAGCGDGDTFDQVGHRHFNVELDKVGKGVELNVTGRR